MNISSKIVGFLALCGCLSFGARPGFRIKGNITGGMEGMKVYLKYADIPQLVAQDSTILHNGRFSFSGTVISPRFYTILFKDTGRTDRWGQDRIINLFVENAAISVQAPYDSLPKEIEMWSGSAISPAVEVNGSGSHTFFLRYDKEKGVLDREKSALFDDYIRFLNPDSGAVRQPRTVGMDLCRHMDMVDSVRKAYVMRFIQDNPSNEVVGYVALQALKMGNITTGEIDGLVERFENVQGKGVLTKKFMEEAPLVKKTAVGSSLVDFSLKDTSGHVYNLSDYVGKGKYVLLECWASWCHPCRADIPHLKEAYALYHPHGFEVISVSLDSKRDNWIKAVDQEKMEWLQLSDLRAFDGDLPKVYHINGIPACLLFDPQGRLVSRNMRGSWMDNRLIEMYGDHSEDAHVSGNIPGLKDCKIIVQYYKDTLPATDTINVTGGKFTWTAFMPEPQKVFMMFPSRYEEFFVESGNIEITGTADLKAFEVRGSKAEDESVAWNKSLKDLTDQEEALYQKYGNVSKEEQIALEAKLTELETKRRERANEYIAAHPASPVSIGLVSDRAMMGEYNDVNAVYQKLDASVQQTSQGRLIAKRLIVLKKSALGEKMVDFTQNDTTGRAVRFTRFKGKYVLVDFWASWCGPCRAENPNVLKAYNEYKGKNFTVLGISLDDKADKWKKAIKDDKMPWTQLSDLKGWKNELAQYYGIQGIPSNLLIDPDGKIVAKDLRGEALHARLAELLK